MGKRCRGQDTGGLPGRAEMLSCHGDGPASPQRESLGCLWQKGAEYQALIAKPREQCQLKHRLEFVAVALRLRAGREGEEVAASCPLPPRNQPGDQWTRPALPSVK